MRQYVLTRFGETANDVELLRKRRDCYRKKYVLCLFIVFRPRREILFIISFYSISMK